MIAEIKDEPVKRSKRVRRAISIDLKSNLPRLNQTFLPIQHSRHLTLYPALYLSLGFILSFVGSFPPLSIDGAESAA
jgi:hypothetical protein